MNANLVGSEKAKLVFEQREKLIRKIETLADCCGRSHGHLVPNATLLKAISNSSCESRIIQALSGKDPLNENARFDSYYRQKSEFATTKILDRVKTALSANGIEATILTEVSTDVGRYDAVVALGDPSKTGAVSCRMVRIEIKASLGIDFEQIGRYLWDPSPLILARVITGHVAKLAPSDLQSYVTFCLEELTSKVDRLLSQKFYAVPGTDCTGCTDSKCVYNKRRHENGRSKNFITLPDTEFAEDLSSFFKNLSYVAERTALMVVEELSFTSNSDLECLSVQREQGGR